MNVAVSLLWPVVLAFALNPPPGGGQGGESNGHRPPPPPREAIDACTDKQTDDDCSFAGREGESISGSCWAPDTEKPLACRPASPPPRDQ
ncbi:MAG: hypothetical protein K0V04_40730 [Deltaproteobacteria bacterium]|nr:hypothetical protein [Deltaproteobacteria bacterium]